MARPVRLALWEYRGEPWGDEEPWGAWMTRLDVYRRHGVAESLSGFIHVGRLPLVNNRPHQNQPIRIPPSHQPQLSP